MDTACAWHRMAEIVNISPWNALPCCLYVYPKFIGGIHRSVLAGHSLCDHIPDLCSKWQIGEHAGLGKSGTWWALRRWMFCIICCQAAPCWNIALRTVHRQGSMPVFETSMMYHWLLVVPTIHKRKKCEWNSTPHQHVRCGAYMTLQNSSLELHSPQCLCNKTCLSRCSRLNLDLSTKTMQYRSSCQCLHSWHPLSLWCLWLMARETHSNEW